MEQPIERSVHPEEPVVPVAAVDEGVLRDRVYEVRGQKVMLDFELAEIYGYTTKAFNQQVQRNIEKFDEDFRFQLTADETAELSRSQNVTLNRTGRGSNFKYCPYAFTEQGVYMLMTVLRGDLATKQSKALIRLFKRLKDHAAEMGGLAAHRDLLRLSMLVADNADAIREARLELVEQRGLLDEQRKMLLEHDDLIAGALEELGEAVKRSEISPVLLQFDLPEDQREFLLLNGRAARADVTYMGIYARARKSVYIVDNYIGLKTLYLLQSVAPGVAVTVFSDTSATGCTQATSRTSGRSSLASRSRSRPRAASCTTGSSCSTTGTPGNGTSTAGPPPRMRRSSG